MINGYLVYYTKKITKRLKNKWKELSANLTEKKCRQVHFIRYANKFTMKSIITSNQIIIVVRQKTTCIQTTLTIHTLRNATQLTSSTFCCGGADLVH